MSLQSYQDSVLGSAKTIEFPGLSALARLVLSRISSAIVQGSLVVTLPNGAQFVCAGPRPGPEAVVSIRKMRVLRRALLSGDIGVALSYADGDWSSSDLTAVIELAAVNGENFLRALQGVMPLRLSHWLSHRRRANSRAGSRRNIQFHYDLGNDFYRLWLDDRMIYSSALFRTGGESLELAQRQKLERIVELVGARGDHEVLEIGCGWGALALELAKTSGAQVTGLTLSPRQLAHAKALAAESPAGERTDFRLQDYRDVGGTFDRIVSVEMIEAVGQEYWPTFFATLRDRLAPSGHALLQAITISDDRFERYSRTPGFIQHCIFPGGTLPSKERMAQEARRAGLTFEVVETFGESYARTLVEWRNRFEDNWERISDLGFDERFHRLWRYYLCYCDAGFRSRAIDVGLYKLSRMA